MAFSVYNSSITNGTKIHAIPHEPSCSDLSQVYKLEYNVKSINNPVSFTGGPQNELQFDTCTRLKWKM